MKLDVVVKIENGVRTSSLGLQAENEQELEKLKLFESIFKEIKITYEKSSDELDLNSTLNVHLKNNAVENTEAFKGLSFSERRSLYFSLGIKEIDQAVLPIPVKQDSYRYGDCYVNESQDELLPVLITMSIPMPSGLNSYRDVVICVGMHPVKGPCVVAAYEVSNSQKLMAIEAFPYSTVDPSHSYETVVTNIVKMVRDGKFITPKMTF